MIRDKLGRFIKGDKDYIPWNKGKTKKDFPQLSNVGFPKGKINFKLRGHKLTNEQKIKLSVSLKGKIHPNARGKPRLSIRGENHPFWKGGTGTKRHQEMRKIEYILWRSAIFTRDNYTCQECGIKNGNGKNVYLEADHIKPWALYPKLRYSIDNGRTLCQRCHRNTDTWGVRRNYESQKEKCTAEEVWSKLVS